MTSLKSKHLGKLEISGEQEKSAAEWLLKELTNTTKSQEILAIHEARKTYNVAIHPTNSHVKETERTIHYLLDYNMGQGVIPCSFYILHKKRGCSKTSPLPTNRQICHN